MKTIWFHMQGYRDLPDDFRDRYDSIWVNPPNDELCHSPEVAKYLHWNLDELEMADDLGFDGLGLNDHHQNGYGFPISPNLTATALARLVRAHRYVNPALDPRDELTRDIQQALQKVYAEIVAGKLDQD